MLKKFITNTISILFGLSCTLAVPSVMANTSQTHEAPSSAAMMADLILVRPLMLGTTALGGAIFALSLPFSILGGNVSEAGKELVVKPAYATFLRCLGCY